MADNETKNKGFKLANSEVLEELNLTISQTGIQAKDWILEMMEKSKEDTAKLKFPEYEKEIDELFIHTMRITKLLNSVLESSQFKRDELSKEFATTRQRIDAELDQKHLLIEQLKLKEEELTAQLASEMKLNVELTERIQSIQEDLKTKTSLVDSQKEIIATLKEDKVNLSDLVAKYQAGYEESETNRTNYERANAELSAKELELTNITKENKERIEEINSKHANELTIEKQKLELEKKNELAEQQLKLQTKHQEAQDKLNNTVQEMNTAHTKAISDLYTQIEKINSKHEQEKAALLKEIEQLKSIKAENKSSDAKSKKQVDTND